MPIMLNKSRLILNRSEIMRKQKIRLFRSCNSNLILSPRLLSRCRGGNLSKEHLKV